MENFTVPIINFVTKRSKYCDRVKWNEAERKLKEWKDYPDKHHISYYYSDQYFGFAYTKSLYRCRVESFYEVLKMISSVSGVNEVLKKNFSIVSVGCGPGPEIAAYVAFMRNQLNVYSTLNFIGIDRVNYWREFLMEAKKCDNNINIFFENCEFDEYYLESSNCHGICIMSYPESVLFTNNVWIRLKTKFNLIIVLDQSKHELHSKLRNAGFTILGFHYLQEKRFAYYVNSLMRTRNHINNNYSYNLSTGRSLTYSGYHGNRNDYYSNYHSNDYLIYNENFHTKTSSNINRNFRSPNVIDVGNNNGNQGGCPSIIIILFIIFIFISFIHMLFNR